MARSCRLSFTLVHAFVASRVDYCGSLLIGAPRKTTDKLQRVLNSAARIVSNTRKFDQGLTHFRRSQLHWLDVVDRVRFRVCVQVFRCLHKMSPEYLSTYCQPVSTCDRLTVVISISHVWNLLRTEDVHLHTPALRIGTHFLLTLDSSLCLSSFKHHLKTFLFSFYQASTRSVLGVLLQKNVLYKFTVIMVNRWVKLDKKVSFTKTSKTG